MYILHKHQISIGNIKDNSYHNIMYITNPIKSHRYSIPLDIHLTTNHFEIKELLDVLYNKYFNTKKK